LSSQEHQEGIMIMLAIISVGSTFLGIFMNDLTLVFGGVAVIVLDTVLLLDYDHRMKEIKAQ